MSHKQSIRPIPVVSENLVLTPKLAPADPKLALAPVANLSVADQAAEKSIRQLFSSGEFVALDQLIRKQLENTELSRDYLDWVRAQIPVMKLGWAWLMIRQRNCSDAIPLLEDIQQTGARALAIKGLGFCYMQNKDFAQASSYLERYLEQQKNDPEAYILLAETKESIGDIAEALALAQKARTLENLTEEETKDLQRREESLSVKTEESYGQSELTAGFIHLRYQAALHQHLVAGSLSIMQQTIEGLNNKLGLAYPNQPIEVIFHLSENFQRIAHGPAWSTGIYDGRVRIPLPEGQQINEAFARVLRHEITHAVLSEYAHRRPLPIWFQEGLAQVAECPELCWHYRFAATQFPFLPMASFDGEYVKLNKGDAQVAYKQSFYLLQVLRYQFGDLLALKLIIEAIPQAEDLSSDGLLSAIGLNFTALHQGAIRSWKDQRSF